MIYVNGDDLIRMSKSLNRNFDFMGGGEERVQFNQQNLIFDFPGGLKSQRYFDFWF